jgi:hypothetical protein
MAAGQKKVVVRRLDGGLAWGYLPVSGFSVGGVVEMMDIGGTVIALPMNEIRHIAYVRDFNVDDAAEPERLGKRVFLGRPRVGGLWVRLLFLDDEALEGVTEFDLAAVNGLAEDGGVTVTPPDGRSNTQKLFVPRAALAGVEVLGWVTVGVKAAKSVKPPVVGQGDLFGG